MVKTTSPLTRCAQLGADAPGHMGAVNIPPYHASTILFETAEALWASRLGDAKNPSYGTDGTPTTMALCEALAELEGAAQSFLTPSGLSALVLALTALTKAGDHILLPETSYGPTVTYVKEQLSRFGVSYGFYPPCIGKEIAGYFQPNTALVMVETPGSITMEVEDLPAIAAVAHEKGARVVADSTWAAPLLWKPFELGADISAWAGTKYLGGHADVLLGVVSAKTPELAKAIGNAHHWMGLCSNGGDAYLALRGLRSLPARLRQHEQSALKIAGWLQSHPRVTRLLHPAFPACPGHAVWKRDFTGSNSLFSIGIGQAEKTRVAAMLNGMKLFKLGYSWGCHQSLMLAFEPYKFRPSGDWRKGEWLLRFHIGLEDPDELMADIQAGLERLER